MLRKFLVIAVQVFLGDDEHGYQIQSGLFVFTCAFMLQALAMPYHNAKERYLELLSLGATMLTMFCGQAIALRGLSESMAATVRYSVATLNIGVLVVFTVIFADEVKTVAAQKKLHTRKSSLGSSVNAVATAHAQIPGNRPSLNAEHRTIEMHTNPMQVAHDGAKAMRNEHL